LRFKHAGGLQALGADVPRASGRLCGTGRARLRPATREFVGTFPEFVAVARFGVRTVYSAHNLPGHIGLLQMDYALWLG